MRRPTAFGPRWRPFAPCRCSGDGASTRAFALETTIGHDDRSGPIQTTGRDLDVAMQGKAWLAVQGNDGTEGYTRAGALEVNAEGQLVTAGGRTVVGDAGPITLPAGARIEVAADGSAERDRGRRSTPGGGPAQAGDARGAAQAW